MISLSHFHSAAFLFLAALLFISTPASAQKSNLNKRAQALAKAITPKAPAKKLDSRSLGALRKQMTAAIQVLESSNRTNGPSPEDLITKALHFRPDIGNSESIILTNTLLDTWRNAHSMGLFDEEGKFTPVIRRGRNVGDKVIFERIIPGDMFPPASNQLANLRLVHADNQRAEGAPLTDWEIATANQLKRLVAERLESQKVAAFREGPRVNQLGQTDEDQKNQWENAMKDAGEIALQRPKLRLSAKMTASPSHMTKDRWRVSFEVINASSHPTEIEAGIWLIGYTEKTRKYFVMKHESHDLKLRSGEVREFDVFTKARKSYKKRADEMDGLDKKESKGTKERYRDFMIRATHETGVADFHTSDARLDHYLDPKSDKLTVEGLPQL